jgi:putative 4-mercaptohistidine N1-methyltranferase
MNIYETQRLVDEYLLFHYARPEEILPWDFGPREALGFPVRTVTELVNEARLPQMARALDLGCAVGRSTFELSRLCVDVTGIDYSAAFIRAAEDLRCNGALTYQRTDEAEKTTPLTALLPTGTITERARFETGDAMNLRDDLGDFDLVHAANLLCRLTEPEKLLQRLPSLVRSGGQLLLTTPCTWLEDFTPKANWPKGKTRDWLREVLSADFSLDLETDMPFLIREHARKYQWSVALGMRWVRK